MEQRLFLFFFVWGKEAGLEAVYWLVPRDGGSSATRTALLRAPVKEALPLVFRVLKCTYGCEALAASGLRSLRFWKEVPAGGLAEFMCCVYVPACCVLSKKAKSTFR